MPRANLTPKKVVEGIVENLAKLDPEKNVPVAKLAEEWGVSKAVVEAIRRRSQVDIQELRKVYAERGFELAVMIQERLGEKLLDPEEMKKTPVRDLALAGEKTVNAAVTAQDGHQPVVSLNFGFISQQMKNLSNYDALRAQQQLAEKRAGALPG